MKIYPSIVLLFLALSQAFGQRFVKVFNTIDAMRTASPDVHTNAFVAGSSTLNDGGQGLFTWDASSTAATNTETIFGSTKVSTGRWFRQSGAAIDNNWIDEGTTNSLLAGIAKTWALHATNYIAVTNATGSAGFIDIGSTNGTYLYTLTMSTNGFLQLQTNGVNRLQVTRDGALLGASAAYDDRGIILYTLDASAGDKQLGEVNFEVRDSDGYTNYVAFYMNLDNETALTPVGSILLESYSNDDVLNILTLNFSKNALFGITGEYDSVTVMRLQPNRDDGTTAYLLDTSVIQSSGNVLEVKNHGTNIFTVAAVSGVSSSNLKLGHAALTADSAVTNFVADFAAEAYRTITAAADVNLLQSTNREAVRTVTLFIEPSGGNRNLTINSSWKKLNTFNAVVTNGTTAVISLTTKGTAETDVFAAFAVTQ